MAESGSPLTLAIVNDYEVVVVGLKHMFDMYADRVEIVELVADKQVTQDVDVVLYDTFAQAQADSEDLDRILASPHAGKVLVYTWNFSEALVQEALRKGASGYLSKSLPASELVEAVEAAAAGEKVVSPPPGRQPSIGGDWPGRAEGLSSREAEVLVYITQGLSNAEIAERACLGANTVKSYIRSAYRKIGVTSRTQAVLWGIEHGFKPVAKRILLW